MCDCHCLDVVCSCHNLDVVFVYHRFGVMFVCRRHRDVAFICMRMIQRNKIYPNSDKKSNQ